MKKTLLLASSAALLFTGALQTTALAANASSESHSGFVNPQFDPSNPYSNFWWGFPLAGSQHTITSDYGNRPGEFHKGIDLRAKFINVYAAQNGTILGAGNWGSNGGLYIILQTDNTDPDSGKKIIARYLHLSEQNVKSGRVTKDQILGVSGNSGGVDPHLHFDVNNAGKYTGLTQADMIDPKIFYPYPRITFTYLNALFSAEDVGTYEVDEDENDELFFDNALIDFVGRDKFENWKKTIEEDEVKLSNFKEYFDISNEKERELKLNYYGI